MKSPCYIAIVICIFTIQICTAQDFTVKSPNGHIQVNVKATETIQWSIQHQGKTLLSPSAIALSTDRGDLGTAPEVLSSSQKTVDEMLTSAVPQKRRQSRNHYNQLTVKFKGDYQLEFRVFDDAAAYRFVTDLQSPMIVNNETIEFKFTADHNAYLPLERSMITHQESTYTYQPLSEVEPRQFMHTPMVVDIQDGPKVAIAESDLYDYPGFYLYGTGEPALTAKFPNFVLEEGMRGDRTPVIRQRAEYIAKTEGKRSFPWRIVVVAEKDSDLINTDVVWKLGRPCVLEDTSWIKPGKVAWDWYNACNLFGVDFKAGVNTDTYKYYIDFASEHDIEYIILDEGWYVLGDLLKISPNMDMEELFQYAKQKNVGIVLWVVWKTLDDQLEEALDQFETWGCKGIKVDFMQRDDQWMVNYYEKIAREAAKRKMFVDFHGSYKPSGLRRAYPNVLTYEGVPGGENNKWSDIITPEHNTTLPFTRMLAGPMDYTPGSMRNAQKKNFFDVYDRPMSLGTRCHQLAMYVVFESPLQMLCDSPSLYYREPECMQFLSPVPAVWDETVVLDAKIGEYILIARQSGNEWYLGAMTNSEPRELKIDLSFLPKKTFTASIWQDGMNADRYASDFKMLQQTVDSSDSLTIKMAPGGGWAARLIPQ